MCKKYLEDTLLKIQVCIILKIPVKSDYLACFAHIVSEQLPSKPLRGLTNKERKFLNLQSFFLRYNSP